MHRGMLALAATLWIAIFVTQGLAVAPPIAARQGQPPAEPSPAGAQYAGTDTCTTCHSDQTVHGAHGRTINARTPMAQLGCEACHGPGKAHADAGGDPALMRAFREMSAGRGEPHLHHVSQPQWPRDVGRERTSGAQSQLHDVP